MSVNQSEEGRHERGALLRRQGLQQTVLGTLHGGKHIPGDALALGREVGKDGAPILVALLPLKKAASFQATKHVSDVRPINADLFAQRNLIHVRIEAECGQKGILHGRYVETGALFEEQSVVNLVEAPHEKAWSRPKRHALVQRVRGAAFRRLSCHSQSPSPIVRPQRPRRKDASVRHTLDWFASASAAAIRRRLLPTISDPSIRSRRDLTGKQMQENKMYASFFSAMLCVRSLQDLR